MNLKSIIILLLASSLMMLSCKDDIVNEMPDELLINNTKKEQILAQEGWKAFTAGDFSGAVSYFEKSINVNSYYADAYNGLGWSYANLDSLNLAISFFNVAQISTSEQTVRKDIAAGRAFANLGIGKYYDAISDVSSAIQYSSYPPSYSKYTFRHDLSIDQFDLLLVKAESHFLLEQYDSCKQTLLVIDDTLEFTTGTPEEIAQIIESFRDKV